MSIDDGFREMQAGRQQGREGLDEVRAAFAQARERPSIEDQLADMQATMQALITQLTEQGRTIAALRERLTP